MTIIISLDCILSVHYDLIPTCIFDYINTCTVLLHLSGPHLNKPEYFQNNVVLQT